MGWTVLLGHSSVTGILVEVTHGTLAAPGGTGPSVGGKDWFTWRNDLTYGLVCAFSGVVTLGPREGSNWPCSEELTVDSWWLPMSPPPPPEIAGPCSLMPEAWLPQVRFQSHPGGIFLTAEGASLHLWRLSSGPGLLGSPPCHSQACQSSNGGMGGQVMLRLAVEPGTPGCEFRLCYLLPG